MSLRPEPIGTIPAETVRVAKAAFPKGKTATRLRDEFSSLYQNKDLVASTRPVASPGSRLGGWPSSRSFSSRSN